MALISSRLAVAAAMTLGLPTRAMAHHVLEARAEEAPRSVSLDLRVTIGQDDEAVAAYLRERIESSLQEANVAIEADAVPTLIVDVRWVTGGRTDYAVTFGLGRPEVGNAEIHAFVCEGCTAPQLLERLGAAMAEVIVPRLVDDAAFVEPESAVEPSAPLPGPSADPQTAKRVAKHETMRHVGFGLLGAGGAMTLGASVGLGYASATDVRAGIGGWVALGGGLAVTAVGAVLVAVARARSRKVAPRRPKATLVPVSGGLGFTGRF